MKERHDVYDKHKHTCEHQKNSETINNHRNKTFIICLWNKTLQL